MEGIFARVREAMAGQDNSIFETNEGRVLAYMNPAGNLAIDFCYSDHQTILVFPDDHIEASSEDTGEIEMSDSELERVVSLLESVVPAAFTPPEEVTEEPTCPYCHTRGRSGPSTLGGPGCSWYCYECCGTY